MTKFRTRRTRFYCKVLHTHQPHPFGYLLSLFVSFISEQKLLLCTFFTWLCFTQLDLQTTWSYLPRSDLHKAYTMFWYLCSLCSSNWQSRQVNLSQVSQYNFNCSFLWYGQNTGRWLVTPTASVEQRKMSVRSHEIIKDFHSPVFLHHIPDHDARSLKLDFYVKAMWKTVLVCPSSHWTWRRGW